MKRPMDHLSRLRVEFESFHAAVGPLDVTVPSCPDWTVGDLIHHVGTVHRTFHRVAREGWLQRPPAAERDDRPAPDDPAIVAWAEMQGELLLDALVDLAPAAPRWNFSHGPQVGAFIPRRMHHETAIHRWDLERSYGAPGPIAEDAALDGIHEYLQIYVPRKGVWSGPAAIMHVIVDGACTFEVRLSDGVLPDVSAVAVNEPDLVVGGAAEPLLLALWDRTPIEAMRRSGNATLLAEIRRHAYT